MKWRGISIDSSEKAQAPRPLRERLLDVRAGIAQYVRPENRQINERAVEWLRNSRFGERALRPGAVAPRFELADQNGRIVNSNDLFARGPLIVSFFRGRWCPFCVAELESWRDSMPQVKEANATMVAISPQKIQHNTFTADQHKLTFPVLSDSENTVAKQFGLAYRVPNEQEQLYRRSFVNLPHLNGDESWVLPLAATFVIAQDGTIRAAFVGSDYRERPEPEEVLKAL
jgi:peroxiredoxin